MATKNPQERYDILTRYFVRGFFEYASPDGALVYYPGLPSDQGYHASGIEGFARTAPLVAAWISATGQASFDVNGRHVNMQTYLRTAILAGTNPHSQDYWGDMKDYSQHIVEAGDIAKLLWLTRSYVWDTLSTDEKQQVKNWMNQALDVKVYPNNWLLFPTVVKVIMARLDGKAVSDSFAPYQEFKSFYTEHGWFFDHPHGFDYYNAWGIPYDLFWITWLDPDFDREFIRKALAESADLTAHLISPAGVPMIGRSVCYRTGIPSPVLAEALLQPSGKALARRSLDAIWEYFVQGGILIDYTLTQGYLKTDARLLDPYSGPGSCHWGLRSLVLAWVQPESFWQIAPAKLPVEQDDYTVMLEKIGWQIAGDKETGEVTITIPANEDQPVSLRDISTRERIEAWLFDMPVRPYNAKYKYHRRTYSSARPPE